MVNRTGPLGVNTLEMTMKASIASMWVFRIGGSYVLARTLEIGVLGVWLAIFLDWGFRAALFAWRFHRGAWRERDLLS